MPGHILLLILAAIIPTLTQSNHARAAEPQKNARNITHTVKSQHLEQDRIISVTLPENYYDNPKTHYPVLYILDGENNLKFTTAIADHLTASGEIPPLIIIGLHAGTTRADNYLPKNDSSQAQTSGQTGHSTQFLTSLQNEILPFIGRTYRTTPYRLLSGHSFGGMFVITALMDAPGLFNGYFAQSPFLSPIMGNPAVARMGDTLENNPGLKANFLMAMGDEPTLEAGYAKMGALLTEKAPKTLYWKASHLAGKSHMQTRFIGIYNALVENFASDWPLKAAASAKNFTAHLEGLEQKYGMMPHYEMEAFAQIVQGFLQTRQLDKGTQVAKAFVAQYPQSPFSHFLLFNAYAMGGKRDDALKEISVAIRIIEGTNEPSMEMQQLYPQLQQMQNVWVGNNPALKKFSRSAMPRLNYHFLNSRGTTNNQVALAFLAAFLAFSASAS